MTDKDLFKAFGKISPEYILEASPDNIKRSRTMSLKWIPIAACFCIIAVVTILALPRVNDPIGVSIDGPTVSPIEPDVEKPWTPPEDVDPPVASSPDVNLPETPPDDKPVTPPDDNPVTPPDNPVTPPEDNPVTPPIGGSDTTFSRDYIDEVYNLVVCDEAIGREVGDKWVNEVFLKLSPEEQNALPNVYMMIADLNIPREALEEANMRLGGNELQPSTIDALYCGDIEEMKKALMSPLALYHEGEIYTFDEIRANRYDEIPKDVIVDYLDFIESECDKNGTLKYDLELIDAARSLYGIE